MNRGKVLPRGYTCQGDILQVQLTQGKITLLSREDEDLGTLRWAYGDGYPTRSSKGIRLSRVVLERALGRPLQIGEEVDHINGDPLDNRRENLRPVTRLQNAWNRKTYKTNRSGFKGVSWEKQQQKWEAWICHDHTHIWLGVFDTPEEASAAYQAAAEERFGKFRRQSL